MGRLAFVIAVLSTSTALAQPAPPPKPPSTGEELAKAKIVIPADTAAEQARRIIKKGDCTGSVATLSSALGTGAEKLTKDERVAGSVILAKCASANKSWSALIQAQAFLLDNAPEKATAEDLIRAYLKLGQDKKALEMAMLVGKRIPSQKANVAASLALIVCHKNDFGACFKASSKISAALVKEKITGRPLFETMLFQAISAGAIGNYDAYDKTIKALTTLAGAKADGLEPIKQIVEASRTRKLFVDHDYAKELALGTYHLLTSKKIKNALDDADALVTLRLINQDKAQKTVKVAIEVPGVTDAMVQTLSLPPGKQITQRFTPPLKIDFDVAKLRAARASQISVKIMDQSGASILDKSLAVQILPRDSLPTRRYVGSDSMRTTFEYSAAWVTPNAPEIDAFLKKAKARLAAEKPSFSGMQRDTLPQVKAIFEELKAHGVSYVMDPMLFDDRGSVQRTRLPSEVLASTNAQCLEGAILYATLLEAIGLEPVMVFKKGHAFIGWKPSKFDKSKEPLFFLETTLTGGPATFEQAMGAGFVAYQKAAAEKQFDGVIGALLDVGKLRKAGYTPQPF